MDRKYLIPLLILIISLFSVNLLAQGTIGVIVNKDLWSSVQGAVEGYVADVEKIEKKTVWLEKDTYTETSSCDDMKADIKAHYDEGDLEGVVLIGDVPIAKYNLHEKDFFGKTRAGFPTDLFYMDMDGSWGGSNGEYSSHSGNKEGEIWVSRIIPSVLSSYFDDEVTMVNEYLARVKARMYGQDEIPFKYVIAGQNQSGHWPSLENNNIGDLGYGNSNIDKYGAASIGDDGVGKAWKDALVEGREYGFVYSHSSPTSHAIGCNISDQASLDLNCRFYNSFACSNALITGANMCGAYAMGDQGLVCVGSSRTGSMYPGTFPNYNTPLGNGDCFGEAFRKWFNKSGLNNPSWHYGMILQGVGTLVLEKYASGPYLTVTSPNGGEEWEQGNTYTIKWGSNVSGNVKIELLRGGTVDKTLAADNPNSGLFEVEVTTDFKEGTDYKVRISSLTNDTILNESAQDFSIIPEFIIAEFPYIQNFDEWDTGKRSFGDKWEQLTDDDFNWTVHTGATPSRVGSEPDKTGPTEDHTGNDGNYLYTEASDFSPQKEAGMITPKFNLSICKNPVLSFYAHMFSAENEMGDLYVDIEVDGKWNDEVIHIEKDQGDKWIEVTQDLSSYLGQRVRIRIRGITGDSWCSDISVDDFMIDGETEIALKGIKTPSSCNLRYYNSRVFFEIPASIDKKSVSIKLFNLQGKLAKTLVQGTVDVGYHSMPVNNRESQLATGLYLCRLEAQGFTKTINVVITK